MHKYESNICGNQFELFYILTYWPIIGAEGVDVGTGIIDL